MNENEKDFIIQYKKNVNKFQDSFPIQIDLMTDQEPPQDLYIEIRVLEDCGQMITSTGETLKLDKNSTHSVRRQDVEHLLK